MPATLKMLGMPSGAKVPWPTQPNSRLGPETFKYNEARTHNVIISDVAASDKPLETMHVLSGWHDIVVGFKRCYYATDLSVLSYLLA